MGNVIKFPTESRSKFGVQAVKSAYTVRDVTQLFGLSEACIRRWTKQGLIQAAPAPEGEDISYDFRALTQFRRVRELRAEGLTLKQVEAELLGQMNLFEAPAGQLVELPVRRSPFEEALLLHERGDPKAAEAYKKAIQAGDWAADAYCNLGVLEYDRGNLAKAIDHLTLSLKHDPRHFESHYNLANFYFDSGDMRLAHLHYKITAELEPNFSHVYFNQGILYALEGNFADARAALNRYKELAAQGEESEADELLQRLEDVMSQRNHGRSR
ncbi:MAG TPA: tetratricopeptide repeat protein [Blastocatellia bacterium]|nr:tetratricopeptide repeat protein [Blastocatellia bacterium]